VLLTLHMMVKMRFTSRLALSSSVNRGDPLPRGNSSLYSVGAST
jgi:hypothetical protein